MTEAQAKRFYFPAWNACARANDWRTERGVLVVPREPVNIMHRDLLAKVYACRDQLALRIAAPLDALRHACHVVAIGKRKSSKDLTNDEMDRIVDLFHVLTDPDNLKFVSYWTDPMRHKKDSLIAAVKHRAPHAYWSHIARSRFHTDALEDLTIRQLQQLCMTLNNRDAQWRRPVRKAAVPAENCPF